MILRRVHLVSLATLLSVCSASGPQPWENAPGKVRPPPPPPPARTTADGQVASGKEPPITPPQASGKKRMIESSPASVTLFTSPSSYLLGDYGTGVSVQKKSRFQDDFIPSVEWLLAITQDCLTHDSLVSLAEDMLNLDKSKYGDQSLNLISRGMSEAHERISGSLLPQFETATLDKICEDIIALTTTTTAMP